jgi:hypothetical protein
MAKLRRMAEVAAIVTAIEQQRAKGVALADCCKAQGVVEFAHRFAN